MAKDLEEFWSIVLSALTIKAALSLGADEFWHSTHLCIRCVCSRRTSLDVPPINKNVMTFVEVGSNVLAGVGDDRSEHVLLFSLPCTVFFVFFVLAV